MKKAILVLAMALAAMLHLPAATETVDGIAWTYSIVEGGAVVCGGSSMSAAIPTDTEGSVAIPERLGDCPVVEIDDWSFYRCDKLTDVQIPSTVTNIGAHAFQYADSLGSVSIPESVVEIESHAFQYCGSLTNVVFEGGTKAIGNYAFANCSALKTFTPHEGLESIGSYAFLDDSQLSGLALPEGFASIGMESFCGCRSLTEMLMPSSLRSVGVNAFSNCTSIANITLPGSLTTTRLSAIFPSYQSLTNITVDAGATKIADYAFQNCKSVETIFIPNSVTNIGYGAFGGCAALRSLTIPFVGTGRGASRGSQALFGYVFGSNCSSTGSRNVRQNYYSNGTTYMQCYIPTNLAEVVVTDESVIGDYAFQNCVDIRRVEIRPGVATIGYQSFYGCSSLEDIVLPDTVTSIGSYSFANCESLWPALLAAFPSSLKTIGSYAFSGCRTALGEIVLPEGVEAIGSFAFENCYSVTNITISSTVTNIGDYAFRNCRSISEFSIPDTVQYIGYGAFGGCAALRSLTIPFVGTGRGASRGSQALFGYVFGSNCSSTGSRNVRQNYYSNGTTYMQCYIPTNLAEVVVTDESIVGDYAFQNCVDIRRVEIKPGATTIGYQSFYGCSSLEDVVLPDTMTSIGSYSFANCESLWPESLAAFPSSLRTIGSYAFSGCKTALGEIVLPEGVEMIGSFAFENCYSVTNITISSTVTNIGDYAFRNCRSISEFSIPDTVQYIGYGAFGGCAALRSLTIPFVGTSRGTSNGSAALFGYVFGNNCSTAGSSDVRQNYYRNGTTWMQCYIPTNLAEVVVTDESVIGDYAFQNCSTLAEVVLNSGVKSIGYQAFYNCTGLTRFVLPDGMTTVGQYAFQNCTNLASISIPDSIETINSAAFSNCGALLVDTETIPNVKLVDNWVVGYTSGLAGDLDLSGVRGVVASVFSGCTGLTSVRLPANMDRISASLFSECRNLRSVTIPAGVTSIDSSAFSGCTSLTAIEIPSSVTNIASDAFQNCSGLTELVLPEGLVRIGEWAFSGCGNLRSVNIPSTVERIDNNAFASCSRLARVDAVDLVSWFGIAFGNSDANPVNYARGLYAGGEPVVNLVVPEEIDNINSHVFYNCTNLTSVAMHDGVTNIAKSAFCYCSGLTNATLSAGLVSIGDFAFDGCVKLHEIEIPSEVKRIGYGAFLGCGGLADVAMPEGLEEIGACAFQNCPNMTAVAIPAAVLEITNSVFYGCANLADVSVPSSVTNIRESAFRDCRSLAEIELPTSLKAIGASAFQGDTGLVRIVIPEGVESIGDSAFSGCTNLAEVVYPSSLRTIGSYAFSGCSSLMDVVIPEGVRTIGAWAFYGCSSLAGVTIPQSVASIGAYAFNGCANLRVAFADGVTSIGNSLFDGCTGLTAVDIPDSVTSIESYAFCNCSSLTEIALPSGLARIGDYAFYGCTGIENFDIPDGVVSFGSYSFAKCSGLKSINFPATLTKIGASAFSGCENLKDVHAAGISQWCKISFGNGAANPLYSDTYDTARGATLYLDGEIIKVLAVPADVREIKNHAFYYCETLESVVLHDEVTNIARSAFCDCWALTNVVFSQTLRGIGDFAFAEIGVGEVEIPGSVKSVGQWAFRRAADKVEEARRYFADIPERGYIDTAITNLVVGEGVMSIGEQAFLGQSMLSAVSLPSTLTSLSTNTFSLCTSINSASVPTGRWTMKNCFPDAFARALECVVVADGSTAILGGTFADCSVMAAVSIPASVVEIADDAFRRCPTLRELIVSEENDSYRQKDGALYSRNYTRVVRVCPGVNGGISLPSEVAEIGAYAFEGCGGVASVTIPAGVAQLPATAFDGTTGMTEIVVADGSAVYKSIDGVVFTKDGRTLVLYPRGRRGNYEIPDGVEEIAASAFSGCIYLTGVELPDSMRSIGYCAFDGCEALTNIDVNENLWEIGSYAFRRCSSLASLTVPDSVAKLGTGAFTGCASLSNLVLPEGLQLEPERLSGTIRGNRELSRGVVYHVTGNLTINSGATLTIPSGAILKMAPGVSITVNSGATLNALGTRAAPIVFTSIKDDTIGGDTNGDGDATTPQGGDWGTLSVSGVANFDYTSIQFGGSDVVRLNGGVINFNYSEIAHAKEYCVDLEGGTWNMRNSVFRDFYTAFRHWSTTFSCVNSVFYDCSYISNNGGQSFVNCIFACYSLGLCWWTDDSSYRNCIFWNSPEDANSPQSCPHTGFNGNIWADPKFLDPANGDFRIASDSPCVDAADGTIAPALDYFGQTRQNYLADATGIADANGKFPDIGICEILPKVVENDVDLAIDGVEAPAVFVVGEKATVSWTVENLGGEPVSGTWSDRVELVCANGSTAVLGTTVTRARLQAGGRRSCTGTFTVPAAQTGAVRVRVTVNANRDVFEGTLTANNVGESGEVALDMPTLEFPATGVASFNVLSGGSAGYRLGGEFAEGGLLIVRMFATGAARPNVGVWTGGGQVPTRDIFYASAVQVADGICIVRVPAGGDAYVAFANDGGTGARVDVEPETGGFILFETGATTAPNAGLVSLTLFGNGFEDGMDVWIAKAGARLDAKEVAVFDSVRAVATFDVTGLDAGAYELHVGKGGEDVSAQLLTLTESRIGPKWSCKLDIANSVRSSREYVGYFEYTNSGDMPLDVPYVKLTANKGSLIRFGTADAWGDTLEFMAISETYPVSQLKPGETRRIPFRYKTTTSSLSINYSWTQDDAREFPWATNGSYMRPTWASDEFWGLSLAVLKSNVGNTWNDYLARMRANCDHLAKIGQPTHRLDRIWQLEVNEAMGVDHAVSTLASNTDLARSGRGFGLALSRSYGSGLYRRLRKGVFGYGWSDNYSAYAELLNSGATLALHSGSGSTYLFEKVNGKWTPEDARDKTVCTETATEYVLSYRSGTVQRISKSNMRVSSVTDNQGNSLTFTYAGEKLTKVEHCDGQALSFSYANGLLVSATDDQGRTTHYEYSGDLLVKVTAFNGLQTQYRYLPADGSVTSRALRQIIYADGTTRDYTYDGAGRVATVSINGNQQTVEIERGALGTYSVIAPNGGTTTVTLGASGEVLETVNALGQKSYRSYTADTLLEAVVGPTGKRAKIAYDEDGQAVKATDAAGAETSFAYTSDFGNLAKVTDARGNSFDYGYDKKGRSKSISYADGSIESIAYDDRGNVTNSVNRRGQSIAFTYDSEGNILSKIWDDGRTFTWAYDAKGNCTNATDSATGAVTMEYDENERLVRIVHPKGRGFEYEYDALGRTISRTMLGGTTTTADIQKYVYDSLGRLSRMTDGDGKLYVENAYDETTGWLVAQTYGNGTVVSNSYDILGRTTKIAHYGNGGELLDCFAYEYDAEGRRISQTTKEGVERYTYDTVGQLTDVIYPDGSEEHFTYDAVGNRISCTTGGSPVADEYTANNLNQYTEIKNPDGVDASLKYDADGNLVWKWDENGVTEYFYDIQNRLVAVTNTTEDIRWSCEYDVFGNRTKVIDHGTATEILFFQGSLASAVAEFGASNSLATRHILLGSVRLASTTGGSPVATRYYHADGLASTRLITDENGDTVASASYRAFGETRISSGDTTSAGWVGTLGVERDDATGLIFMRNRYYDAGQGRFIQMDPIGLMAGDVNVYCYCMNDVADVIDTDGCSSALASIAEHSSKVVSNPIARAATKKTLQNVATKTVAKRLNPIAGAVSDIRDICTVASLIHQIHQLERANQRLTEELNEKHQELEPASGSGGAGKGGGRRGKNNQNCNPFIIPEEKNKKPECLWPPDTYHKNPGYPDGIGNRLKVDS